MASQNAEVLQLIRAHAEGRSRIILPQRKPHVQDPLIAVLLRLIQDAVGFGC